MNKAFVREPEDTGQRYCPECRSLGIAVRAETLQSFLMPDALNTISETGYFCPFAFCDVAYFDDLQRVAKTDCILRPVYPKDPGAPLCGCFGLTSDDIEADLAEGGVRRVKELLAKAKSPLARCQTMSPSGQSCVAEVQRYYMRRRSQAPPA